MHLKSATTRPIESVKGCAVYDDRGTIVHVHTVVTMEGAAGTSDDRLRERALELANRRLPEAATLATVIFDPGAVEAGVKYRVDVASQALVQSEG